MLNYNLCWLSWHGTTATQAEAENDPQSFLTVETRTLERYSTALARTQRLAGIGTMTASVAHELNNPISVIATTCQDLLAQMEAGELSEESLRQQLGLIEQSAWRCARLVQTLRTYTHVEQPQVMPTDLNEIIADGLTLVGYQFRHQFNVEITTDLAGDLAPVQWERNQITQVLVNLLTNARDALQPDGGTIHITSWSIPAEDAVAFSIHDSGPGIPPQLLERIFDPFFTTKPAGEQPLQVDEVAANS
jgi:signal transduction histidine kinase